jgi:hypothetical protein
VRSHSQQKRSGSCYCNSLALDGKSTLDKSLQPSRPKDARQRPARKRQETLTRSRRDDETLVLEIDHLRAAIGLAQRVKSRWRRSIENAVAGEKNRSRGSKFVKRSGLESALSLVWMLVASFYATAPDLPASRWVVVEQENTLAVSSCAGCGRDAGWSCAHNNDIGMSHCSVSTTMPSLQVS